MKLPDMRIPKKYRDGKLLGAAINALEQKLEAARQIEETGARFDALARLETKASKQFFHVTQKIWGVKNNKMLTTLVGNGVLSVGLLTTGVVISAPLLIPAALGTMVFGTIGVLVTDDFLQHRGKKKPLNPVAQVEQLRGLWGAITQDMTQTALADPLPLIEAPRFKQLCGQNADLRDLLTEAFKKAQSEKPAPAPDLTSALAKPRLPSPRKN